MRSTSRRRRLPRSIKNQAIFLGQTLPMPLFGLRPVPAQMNAPVWAGSTHHGPCYVMAVDEERARHHAAIRFASADGPAQSPWVEPSVVVNDLTFYLVDGAAAEGTVVALDDEAAAAPVSFGTRTA